MFDPTVKQLLQTSERMSRPVYRGQADADWKVTSGAVRRIENFCSNEYQLTDEELSSMIQEYQRQELIEPLNLMGRSDQTEELMLAELQHHGAATQLVDFTENPLVALWFACSEYNEEKDGKIFVIDIGNPSIWINGRHQKWLSEDAREFIYYEPDRSLSPRIAAQLSLFLVANPNIPEEELKSLTVRAGEKPRILKQLERLGISERVLFADLPGLATLNSARRKWTPQQQFNPGQCKRLGQRAFQNQQFKIALNYYSEYAKLRPQFAEPFWLKGNAFAALKKYDRAVLEYDRAIELKDKPLPAENVQWEPLFIQFNLSTFFFNSGNAHAALNHHEKALHDFDQAIKLGGAISTNSSDRIVRDSNYNKANSYFVLGQFSEAFKHFKISDQNERSVTKLGMGNSCLMQAKLQEARDHYYAGTDKEPRKAAESCRANLNALEDLIQAVGDEKMANHATSSHELVIVVKGAKETIFNFTGNTGNYGNWGGGEGYSGKSGFAAYLINEQTK